MFSRESKRFSWDWWKNPNRQVMKADPSCTRLKEYPKLTEDKVHPSCVIRWKDHMLCNSNKCWGRKRQCGTALSTASDEVCDGCTGWCQRPNTTPGTWTKSVHWDKQSGYKWHFKSTNQWHTTCQLWASHFCHCIPTSCSYSSLLFASWEDLQSQPAVLRAT